ncbi:hypothetical protein QQS21_009302 [Conoideocrella luteorostrata]|uniref:Uncharacterized protein n=1 Tax=Conoideocrella luteorostrata TaxID=1105319 RepID=A0AAJ0CI50_9HYPO|nr:hypothetical protein QQS21_009302 [Conoideocrella luteorostrata]
MNSNSAESLPSAWYEVLRSVGLHLLAQIPFVRRRAWGRVERPKPIIRNSFPTTLAHLSVHVLPVLTSIAIIALNFKHLFLGRTIPGPVLNNAVTIAAFQVCAKLHELLIVASLSIIVLSVIREQLISGAGLPLGFLCSGFTFSQLSYFWSEAYWGAVGAQMPRCRKIITALLLLLAGLIATTAGPSSAVLMVPREQEWNAGGSEFYLRGNMSELFPAKLTAFPTTINMECLRPDAFNYAMCPSSGLSFLSVHTSTLQMIKNGANLLPPPNSIFGPFGSQRVNVASLTNSMPRPQLVGSVRGLACQTAVIAPYIPAIAYQQAFKADWDIITGSIPWSSGSKASKAEYKYNRGSTLKTSTKIPVVRAACSTGQNISAAEKTIRFPVLPKYSCWHETTPITFHQLNETPSDRLRITWSPLPSECGLTSTGMIFESPWTDNGVSRLVVGCSVDARWANGTVDGVQGYAQNAAPSTNWGRIAELNTPFRPPDDGSWVPITFDKSWLNALTPVKQLSNSTASNLTTLEYILMNSAITDSLTTAPDFTTGWNNATVGSINGTLYLEWITTVLVADGVSRYGSDKALNTSGPVYDWSLLDYRKRPDFDNRLLDGGSALYPPSESSHTSFYLDIEIQGLAYLARTITDYLAVAVLLIHICLVLCHSAYLIRTGKTSAAWDSIIETFALAHNSRPSDRALCNTSAGIKCMQTYRKLAVVRATEVSMNMDEIDPLDSHAELVFLEDEVSSASPDRRSTQIPVASTWSLSPQRRPSGTELELRRHSGTSISFIPLIPQQDEPVSEGSNVRRRDFAQRGVYETIMPDRLYS